MEHRLKVNATDRNHTSDLTVDRRWDRQRMLQEAMESHGVKETVGMEVQDARSRPQETYEAWEGWTYALYELTQKDPAQAPMPNLPKRSPNGPEPHLELTVGPRAG
jgi:hypothetical protein